VRRRRSAYTLLELLLVVAVLCLLVAVSAPSIDGMGRNLRLQAAADDVRAAWAQARARAISEGQPYRFGVITDKGDYRVAPDDPNYWNGGDPPQPTDPNNPPLVLEKSLPKGITFSGVNTNPGVPGSDPSQDSSDDPNAQYGSAVTTNAANDAQPLNTSATSAGPDASGYTPAVTFLPDGTANQDVEVTFKGSRGRPVILRLRALTGSVTVRR
jgi:prepilin-type N-terminal cleavage/methylation domain-containing protein